MLSTELLGQGQEGGWVGNDLNWGWDLGWDWD